MTDLGPILFVLAAQITIPVVGGLLLSRRRDPAAACGPLVVAAAAAMLLTPLAFTPRPSWPTMRSVSQVDETVSTDQPETAAATGEMPGGIDVLSLLRLPHPEPAVEAAAKFDGWHILAYSLFVLAVVGMARLAVGLWTTTRVTRSARPVTDQALVALASDLRLALECRRTFHLRESDRVGTAATAGWRRPVILISPEWRHWSNSELRVVLAHEIAHVARGDFGHRLLARLAVAIHGYHPLVRWLAARLELRQEMAADARAAGSCGGRSAYLKCLASIALRADDRPLGVAPTFLSRPLTLLRRIAMLRVTEDTAHRGRRWPALAGVALLSACALGLHGTTPDALADPVVRAKAEAPAERPPLDCSFILPSDERDQVGNYAVRVGALFRTPGMEALAEMYSGLVMTLMGEGKKAHFKLSDIEQISGRVAINHDPKKPTPNRSLMMSLTSLRMEKDFDWIKQLREWSTDWTEHTHDSRKYYSCKMTVALLGPKESTMWFYLPDGRTMVLESEENIKKLIDARGTPAAAVSAADWKSVEGGTVAIVLPDVKGKLAPKVATDKVDDAVQQAAFKSIAAICNKTKRATIGLDLHNGCTIELRLACATAADAIDVDDGCQAIIKLASATLADDAGEPKDEVAKAGKKFSTQLLHGVEFNKTVDHIVGVRMSSKDGAIELLKAFSAAAGK